MIKHAPTLLGSTTITYKNKFETDWQWERLESETNPSRSQKEISLSCTSYTKGATGRMRSRWSFSMAGQVNISPAAPRAIP
ncbi:hypothetical protein BC835DRAFT_1367169 [Cytidiella melzeri]|nr:hypothetical protein BC835DRAFT_1367169 [Cytidiella melzeri]